MRSSRSHCQGMSRRTCYHKGAYPKYTLKDENIEIGGNGNSRYEMVFDGDTQLSSEQQKQQREIEPEVKEEKLKARRQSYGNMKKSDHGKRESGEKHARDEKSRCYKEDDRSHESSYNGSGGEEYHRDYRKHHKESSNDEDYRNRESRLSGSRRDKEYHQDYGKHGKQQ